ncbi:MAG: HAMP domain-containing histidine kinase [Melioribacteraceae bacterium]|nr:HAMP domain-containing histidine kinase [Melioribacteraceae bacterium]
MFRIVPEWAYNYQGFWDAVKFRNIWFIKLRYFAVFLLFCFLTIISYYFSNSISSYQKSFILKIILAILFYNVILHYFSDKIKSKPKRFNCLHYSLLQMVLDLAALLSLVYITGGIESPFYLFFIFHMIIGSLILPGRVVYLLALGVISGYSLMAFLQFLQFFNFIESHLISELIQYSKTPNILYISYELIIFSFMIITSVFLANHIAHNLYKREMELKHALDLIKENEIAKQKYIMGLVHEIKTPISAVRTMLDLIIENFLGPVSDEVGKKLLQSRKRTNETISLINNVLRISKLKLLEDVSKENLFLKELIDNVIEIIGPEASEKNIKISLIEFDEKEFSELTGDKILLELAISNLVNNAVKYGNDNGRVIIDASRNGDFINLNVADDGVGIPGDEIHNIFNQFYRASNIKKKNKEGAGMGLSVVSEIIKRHGGEIKVVSPSKIGNTDSPGTQFTVILPIHF